MARREWQNPSILERETAHGRVWYFRYRRKVVDWKDSKPVIGRREVWHELGLCSKMTKRQAEREKDKVLRDINNECYTVKSQVPMAAFLRIFKEEHIPTLAIPSQKTYLQHIKLY